MYIFPTKHKLDAPSITKCTVICRVTLQFFIAQGAELVSQLFCNQNSLKW